MALYPVTYKCGHHGEVDIRGKLNNREFLRVREEGKLCPECFETDRLKKREEAGDLAVKECRKLRCARLEGSDAQVRWAEQIRFSFIGGFPAYIESVKADREATSVLKSVRATYRWARGVKDAKFWIDNRKVKLCLSPLDSVRKKPTANQVACHLIILSPHTTLPVSEYFGISKYWFEREKEIREAKTRAEELAGYEAAKEAASSAGIRGKVARWWNKDFSKVRFYLNDINTMIEMEPGKTIGDSVRVGLTESEFTEPATKLWHAMVRIGKTHDCL